MEREGEGGREREREGGRKGEPPLTQPGLGVPVLEEAGEVEEVLATAILCVNW